MPNRIRDLFGFTRRRNAEHIIVHAALDSATRNSLPDSDFAFVDKDGKGHLPIEDAAHVKDAESRFNQEQFPDEAAKRGAWAKILAAGRKFGIKFTKTLGDNGQLIDKDSGPHHASFRSTPLPEDGSAPEWIELLPLGTFMASDGRGPFHADGPEIIEATKAKGLLERGLPIDYDHRTYFRDDSRAAGWIRDMRVAGDKLQGRVEWTPAATAAIKTKEYRFVSPSFQIDPDDPKAPPEKASGRITYLKGAGLVNDPALSMTALSAAATREVHMKGKPLKMSEICATLEKAFPNHKPEQIQELAAHAYSMQNADAADGDPDGDGDNSAAMSADATEAETAEHHQAMAAERAAKGVVETPAQKAEREAREATEILAAHARDTEREARGGSRTIVRTRAADIASHPMVVKMAREISILTSERAAEKAEQIVNAALREHRIIPAQKEWATAYCKADPAGFAAFLAKTPVIVPQSDGSLRGIPPAPDGTEVLSTVDQQMCEMFKLDAKKFAAHKAGIVAGKILPRRSLSDNGDLGGGMREVA